MTNSRPDSLLHLTEGGRVFVNIPISIAIITIAAAAGM